MDFDEVLAQTLDLLQRQGKVSYSALRRRFDLDDAYLNDLKDELLFAHPVVDEDGKGLVWTGETASIPVATRQPDPLNLQPVVEPAQPVQATSSPVASHTPEAERRQLTVMFVDLVGSTSLSGELDPEELREVVRAYQATCTEVIHRYDGYVAQFLGDGLLVYFGYPQAHEDDAQRAIHTGLGIVETIGTLNTRLEQDQGITLAVRLGIHTGLVVIGEMGGSGRQEPLALGETPNLAARLQGLAEPDTVVISAHTYRLIHGYFDCESLGEHDLRGVSQAIVVYRVVQASGAQNRLDIARARGLTPLVGREQEVGLLLERWEQAKDGQGQVVLLSGEAGIGKSRLVQVLKDHAKDEPHAQLECRCLPYHTNSAFYPLAELLQRKLGWQPEDTADEKLHKLETVLAQTHLDVNTAVPLFTALLSVPLPDDRYPPIQLSSQQQRQQTLEAFLQIVLLASEQHPVLFIVEDLHWVDPSTLKFLELLIDQTPMTAIFILFTSRPEFQPTWLHRSYLTEVSLSRLSRHQVEQMTTQVASGKALPTDVIEQLVDKTDGVPLYVEEMTKAVLESGILKETHGHYELAGSLTSLSIPATLQDSLMARLDRLVTAKAVAQHAAVIGRQCSYVLLQAVTRLDAMTLQHELKRLVGAELLYQRGLPPQATYIFKHALIQDAAYQSLLKSTRQQYHQRIAQTLEAQFPEIIETQPELLAHHYTEAGLLAQAVDAWQQAGLRADTRSAYAEAIAHFTRALDVLQTMPETPQHIQRAIELHTALGWSLQAVKGYTATEAERAYTRALELCQQIGAIPHRVNVLLGLWVFRAIRGELRLAREIGEQLLTLAPHAPDEPVSTLAHMALGFTVFHLGELAAAHHHLAQGIVLYGGQTPPVATTYVGGEQDPKMLCLAYTARALWLLGYPDQALQQSQEALAHAQTLAHPLTLLYAMTQGIMLQRWRGDTLQLQEHIEAARTLATAQGIAHIVATSTFKRGLWLLGHGQEQEGYAEVQQGLTAYRAMGAHLELPYMLAQLAETYGSLGQPAEGLAILVEALALVETTGERWWETELYRLKGELLLATVGTQPSVEEAEACMQKALALARYQQAKSLELRAAMSLSRLWQSQNKHKGAYDLLVPVYDWFTEGFETADLKDAKVLLDELER